MILKGFASDFDRKKALKFLKVYTDTKNSGGAIFNFEGVEWSVSYAKYMLEYLVQLGILKEGEIK